MSSLEDRYPGGTGNECREKRNHGCTGTPHTRGDQGKKSPVCRCNNPYHHHTHAPCMLRRPAACTLYITISPGHRIRENSSATTALVNGLCRPLNRGNIIFLKILHRRLVSFVPTLPVEYLHYCSKNEDVRCFTHLRKC